jgi:hypothetical protein
LTFETVSAFGTVGLSTGVTGTLSDSGVVIRISGGIRAMRRRSSPGVSPDRTATEGGWKTSPCSFLGDASQGRSQIAFDIHGQRFERRNVKTRQRACVGGSVVNLTFSIAARKAASVLPEPVGAKTSVDRPSRSLSEIE